MLDGPCFSQDGIPKLDQRRAKPLPGKADTGSIRNIGCRLNRSTLLFQEGQSLWNSRSSATNSGCRRWSVPAVIFPSARRSKNSASSGASGSASRVRARFDQSRPGACSTDRSALLRKPEMQLERA